MRADIVAARLAPGAKLALKPLSAAYGCGITPLREALCQLAGVGLVVLENQRGFRVAEVSSVDFGHLVAVRRHLELLAVDDAVSRGESRWRKALEEASSQFARVAAKAGDPRPIDADWDAIHRRYHFCLVDAWRSPTLLQLLEQLYDKFDRYRRIAIPTQAYMAAPARDHRRLTEAALAGRRDDVRHLLGRHLDDITEVIRAASEN